jgi:hypothetical protein
VLRAAGEPESRQENMLDWLELDEGDPGFQFLAEKEIAVVIYLFICIITAYIITFSIYLFFGFCFLSFRAIFCFTNPDYRLTPMASNPD